MVGQLGFSVILWFLYIYAVASIIFLTVNIFRRGFIKLKSKQGKEKTAECLPIKVKVSKMIF